MITTELALILDKDWRGENSVILTVLTENQGIQKITSKFKSNDTKYQVGNLIQYSTHSCQNQYLKPAKVECIKPFANLLLSDYKALLSINTFAEITILESKENSPARSLFNLLKSHFEKLLISFSVLSYVCTEISILRECGYGLDLSRCAATKSTSNLKYVSPKSGKAVCYEVGKDYHDKLLPLPQFIVEQKEPETISEIKLALQMTGYFINRYIGIIKSRDTLSKILTNP